MNREIPIWMILLITLFGITTVSTFGALLFTHGQKSSRREALVRLATRRANLIDQENRLAEKVKALKNTERVEPLPPIPARKEQLEWMKQKIAENRADIETSLMSENENLLAIIDESIATQARKFASAYRQCKEARENLATEETNARKTELRIDEDRQTLRDQVATKARELEEYKRLKRDEIKVLDDKIATLDARNQELVDRADIQKDDLISDGKLLEARASHGFVIINRGIEDNLRRGTTFTVYNRRGGKNFRKGKIEVMTLYPHMAECRVLEETEANDPLIPGDHIHNAIYNPDEVKIFVVKGVFESYSPEELKYFIRSVGGRVDNEVTVQTHYLVVGKDAEDSIREAKLRGVTILSEAKLLDFVRTPARGRIRRGMTFVLRGDFKAVEPAAVIEFIRSSGGVVSEEIDHRVDALIAGQNCTDAIIAARASGIDVILEEDLINLTGGKKE